MKLRKNFGWFEKDETPQWQFSPQQGGLGWRKVNAFSHRYMIKFGNDFGKGWLDHRQVPHNDWWFYDNPELSHFTYPNPANPTGLKSFIRLTPGALFTTPQSATPGGTAKINDLLSELSGQPTYWHDIVMPRTVLRSNSRKVLICPSSPNCHKWYYGEKQQDWITAQTATAESLGYTVEVWRKPTREARAQDTKHRLYNRLLEGDVLCTISQHSASALETIVAGVPAVVTGEHGTGVLGTPIEEFRGDGSLRTPHAHEVEAWLDCVFNNLRHKRGLITNTWHES